MSLIKKPSELEVKSTLSAMIYGQPGIGKTTLACSAPSPVLLDYDNGVARINAAHQVPTVQVKSWEDTQAALEEIKADGSFRTLIIDTVGKMLTFMEDYIKRTNPRMKQGDGSLSLKGYGVRKQMFIQLLKDTSIMGMNVIFVAHEREEKDGDNRIVRPEVSGSAAADLVKELDLVGYMCAVGSSRTISFDPIEKCYTKNTTNLHGVIQLDEIVDESGNATGENRFFTTVVEAYKQKQAEAIEENKVFEALMAGVDVVIGSVKDAKTANEAVEKLKKFKHVRNTKGLSAQMLAKKCAELNLKLNKESKCYE